MKRNRGLRKSLLKYFVLLSLAPLFSVGAVSYLLASRSLEARIAEYLEEQAFRLVYHARETT